MDVDLREGIAGGLFYSDSAGVNLQVFFPQLALIIFIASSIQIQVIILFLTSWFS